MNFCTVKETAERWGVSERFVRKLCKEGRIENVVRDEDTWLIPSGIEKPGRKKYEKKPPLDVDLSDYAKRIVRQRIKNNHYGIYEYIQLNLSSAGTMIQRFSESSHKAHKLVSVANGISSASWNTAAHPPAAALDKTKQRSLYGLRCFSKPICKGMLICLRLLLKSTFYWTDIEV